MSTPRRLRTAAEKWNLADLFHHELTAWVVLCLSLLITAMGWILSSQAFEKRARDRFDFEVNEARERIKIRINEYEQLLRGGVAFFDAHPRVSREEWRTYVVSLDLQLRLPGVQGFAFAEKVLPHQLDDYIQRIRSEGFSDYEISPEGPREVYFPITLIEPFDERNRRAFGFDMYSEPVRRQAMIRAMDTGEASVSGLVQLKQVDAASRAAGFLIYLPVYEPGAKLDSVQARRKAIRGFVYSPFIASDLMKNVLGNKNIPVQFELYDSGKISSDALLYRSRGNQPITGDLSLTYDHTREATVPIELSGRTWTAHFGSTPEFDREVHNALPNLILVAGGIIDLLLFLTLYSLVEQRKRESLSKAKSLFLANMSHEIRTPLHAILGLNNLLGEQVTDPKALRYVQQVREASEQLLCMVEDVFSFSEIESGSLQLDSLEFDLYDTASKCLRVFTGQAQTKGLDLFLEIDPMTPLKIRGDPKRFRQVLSNLLNNALKFSERGHVRVKLQADYLGNSTAVIRTEVHDQGIGCDIGDFSRLTKPFEQADNTTTRRFGGSGLGLAICKRLTDLMGGELFATSTPGVGSLFGFTMRVQAVYSQPVDDTAPDQAGPNLLVGKKILVVEDNQLNQHVIKALLKKMNAEVKLVENGQLAVDAVLNDPEIDLVLMDVHMPVMNGIDATRAIRRLPGPAALLPIVALTAGALQEDEQACRAAGMNDFLTKPVDVPKLRRVLGSFLSRVH
jgi:signal transduction histidine kinase